MKKAKMIFVIFLTVCFTFLLSGCNTGSSESSSENLKDNLINGYNDFMKSISKNALTSKNSLQGKKAKGEDEYTGSYTAEYDKFNGEEFIFGGTALERKKGSNLKVTYTLEIREGSATIYWISSGDKRVIAEESTNGVYNMTIGSGDNYISVNGDKFSGNVEITVEDNN